MIKFKNFYYFESRDHLRDVKQNLHPSAGSEIKFYKNGKALGTAFSNINDGIYYPAISLYRNAKVHLYSNFRNEVRWFSFVKLANTVLTILEM